MTTIFSNAAADRYHASTQMLPTDMRSAEMSFLSRQIRERAFWSAGVDNARVLADLQNTVRDVISGKYSDSQARLAIKESLARNSYVPAAGTEGSIKDLRSMRRQQMIIDVNAEMARGYAQHAEAQEVLEMYPCQELFRLKKPRIPRDWITRWKDSGGTVYGERMIAQVNDAIWTKISRFGNPYPPFDFNSGMWIRPVSMADSVKLGVIKSGAEINRNSKLPSINANLETKLNAPDALWDEVIGEFKGFAERDGDVLRFTDPNGTRPYSATEIVDVIGRDLPDIYRGRNIANHYSNAQANALSEWALNPDAFRKTPWSDMSQDMRRLVERIEPIKNPPILYRGLNWDKPADAESFIKASDSGVVTISNPFESYSKQRFVAERFMATATSARGVLLEVRAAKSAKDMMPVIDKFCGDHFYEDEVMFASGVKFKVLSKREFMDGDTTIVHFVLEEIL